MSEEYIGVMTGNSLDATDVVLTRFDDDGTMMDIASASRSYPKTLTQGFNEIRNRIAQSDGNAYETVIHIRFLSILTAYMQLVADTVSDVLKKAQRSPQDVIAIGFHGQTCAHCPPSIAGQNGLPYTMQVGLPKYLARRTGIPVVYDFRSDDLFFGGEGAPFAPFHNKHMAKSCGFKGMTAFCNAGNTGNIAFVDDKGFFSGFDCGPFNHFIDRLIQKQTGALFDENGKIALSGCVRRDLLEILWNESVQTASGQNFYEIKPPKSADPQWYRLPEKTESFPFEDIVRTCAYLGAYGIFHALSFLPENVDFPEHFVLFGGGWKNPACRQALEDLIRREGVVLPRHRNLFASFYQRLPKKTEILTTQDFSLSPQYTEARIFADAAYCFVHDKPFTFPETTGCFKPTVCGVFCVPENDKNYPILLKTDKKPVERPLPYSRATKVIYPDAV